MPHRTSSERDTHPPEPTNVRSPASLAHAPSFNRTNHRADNGRVESSRTEFATPKSSWSWAARASQLATSRKSANFYHHRHLETRTRRDANATRRNEAQSSPTTPSRALSTLASLSLAPPPPTPYAARSPHTPGHVRAVLHVTTSFPPSLSLSSVPPPRPVSVSRTRRLASLRRERETPPYPSLHPPPICRFFLALAPARNGWALSFPLAFLLHVALSSFDAREIRESHPAPVPIYFGPHPRSPSKKGTCFRPFVLTLSDPESRPLALPAPTTLPLPRAFFFFFFQTHPPPLVPAAREESSAPLELTLCVISMTLLEGECLKRVD